ncbi:unnamed protein product [Calypogeia fissa]
MVSVAHFQSLLRIYHKDKEGSLYSLRKFDLSEKVCEAISRGECSINTQLVSQKDVRRLKRMGLQTEDEVDLVVEFPWSFLSIVSKANDTQLRRRVLAMAVDRIRKEARLKRVLALKGLATCTVRENPYLGPGHAPYENFIESLLQITDTNANFEGEEIFKLFLRSAADDADETALTSVEKRGLRTVFHGTDHAVMDAILNSGLDPNCRRNGRVEDFFGIDYNTSLRYTKQKTVRGLFESTCYKLLVFLIIVETDDEDSDDEHLTRGHLTVKSNKLQLPLAEITLQ